MGYLSIGNLYKEQKILEFPEAFALEKIHGCSSHASFNREQNQFLYHGGGIPSHEFKALLPSENLEDKIRTTLSYDKIVIYGESYGGKMQKNQWRYGPVMKFVAFDVKVDGDRWLTVPEAEALVLSLGLEFVHYVRISTTMSQIDFWRDATSEQAIRNGVTTRDGAWIRREGVVLRTIDEAVDHRGNRIIAKHKRDEERETKTPRVVDTAKLEVLKCARAVSEEWVTENRLVGHILPKLVGEVVDMTRTKEVISAMLSDIHKEGLGEFEPGPEVNAEIGKRTAQLLKQHFEKKLREGRD